MKIVHLPFCYHPDPVGGTEIYVEALGLHLQHLGHEILIAAPGPTNTAYAHNDLRVRRFALTSKLTDISEIYGEGDVRAAAEFGKLLDEEQPDIVHMHALTAGVSLRLLRQAKHRGIAVVFTYHTPTVSCLRGTLMRWGKDFCDGKVKRHLCARCNLHSLGMNRASAAVVGSIPVVAGRWMRRRQLRGRVWTALRMSELVDLRHSAFISLMQEADHLVAVCAWGRDVLARNGVDPQKVSLCRHGLAQDVLSASMPAASAQSLAHNGVLRVAFVGRYHHTKGLHVLLEVFRDSPDLAASLDVFGIAQDESGRKYQAQMEELARLDSRITFNPPIPSRQVVEQLRNYDVLAIPSQWLETGPLVALEAFAAGIPVIGWNVGGTAELIQDGVNGLLVDPGPATGWTHAIQRLATEPGLLQRLRSGVRPPRKSAQVAHEMSELYQRISL